MASKNEQFPRPFGVTLLAAYAIWLAAWNALRLGSAIYFWKTLAEYGTHPVYVSVSGGVWLVGGVALALGLWRGRGWAWFAGLGGAAGYAVWYWLDRLVLQMPQSANWPFALAATGILLAIIFVILFARSARRFFKRNILW